MPMYAYSCETCKKSFDEPRSVAERDTPVLCPTCGHMCNRDIVGSMRPHAELEFAQDMLSDALGVHATQIADAKSRFPSHRFAPDGRMIFSSASERKRVMKDLGFHDNSSYY